MKRARTKRTSRALAVVPRKSAVEIEVEVLPPNHGKVAIPQKGSREIDINRPEYDVLRDNREQEYVIYEGKAVALAPINGPFPYKAKSVNTELCVRYLDVGIVVVLGGLSEEDSWVNPLTKKIESVHGTLPKGAYFADGAVWYGGRPYPSFKAWVDKPDTLSVVPPEASDFVLQAKPVSGNDKTNETTHLPHNLPGGIRQPRNPRLFLGGPPDADD